MTRRLKLAIAIDQQCQLAGLPKPVTEYRFHEIRLWRFDYCWPARRLALEVDGGGFVNGRHSRGSGIEKDCEKYSEAVALGWRVLRVTPRQVESGAALDWLTRALQRD
jgi:very-short-patch-repair endonuclease